MLKKVKQSRDLHQPIQKNDQPVGMQGKTFPATELQPPNKTNQRD
jgi:hypothetical protein